MPRAITTIFLKDLVALKRAVWVDGLGAPVALRLGRRINADADMDETSFAGWHWNGRRGPTCDGPCPREEEEERIGPEGLDRRGRT